MSGYVFLKFQADVHLCSYRTDFDFMSKSGLLFVHSEDSLGIYITCS